MKPYCILLILCLWSQDFLMAQEIKESTNGIRELQFRVNWIGSHYSRYFSKYGINDQITNKHLFIYDDQEETRQSDRYNYYLGLYRYYYIGASFSKSIKKINNSHLFFRSRFDYFYYNFESSNYNYYNNSNNDDIKYVEYNSYFLKSWQVTPGVFIARYWKYFNYKIGAEIPLHLRGSGKGVFMQTYNGYNTVTGEKIDRVAYSPILQSGGYFIGLSIFSNISFSLKNFSIGIEDSGGVIFVHSFTSSSYNNKNNRIFPLVHYPSVTFSYKFP